jgi:hypothetical protein
MACLRALRAAAAAVVVPLLSLRPAAALRCHVSVCTSNNAEPPSSTHRCFDPMAFMTVVRECPDGMDRCQRLHISDPSGRQIPAAGVFYYRCASAAVRAVCPRIRRAVGVAAVEACALRPVQDTAQYHCTGATGNAATRGTFAEDASDPASTLRYWCDRHPLLHTLGISAACLT